MTDPLKIIENLQKLSAERRQNELIHLPEWPEAKRGSPNSFIRSALFAAIQGKDRTYLKGVVLASQRGITVTFTGEQLNQEDLAVWEALVHAARPYPLGHLCEFSAYALLRALGLSTGLSQHKQLHTTIRRLASALVEIEHEERVYFGTLIKSGVKDKVTGHYVVELNRDLIRLFGETQWTALDWNQRLLLRGKPVAQALHAFYSSHRHPFPMKLETLHALLGSQNSEMKDFRRKVKAALDELKKIGFLNGYTVDKNMVTVERR